MKTKLLRKLRKEAMKECPYRLMEIGYGQYCIEQKQNVSICSYYTEYIEETHTVWMPYLVCPTPSSKEDYITVTQRLIADFVHTHVSNRLKILCKNKKRKQTFPRQIFPRQINIYE